jgi:hypothetical protein
MESYRKISTNNHSIILLFFLLEGAIIVVTNLFLGNFVGFIMIAAVVSFSYMLIQIIGGFSLIKLSMGIRSARTFSVAVISTLILGVTFVFSFIADVGPRSPTRLSILAVIVLVLASVLVSLFGSTKARKWYNSVEMLNKLEIKDADNQ